MQIQETSQSFSRVRFGGRQIRRDMKDGLGYGDGVRDLLRDKETKITIIMGSSLQRKKLTL